MLKETFTDLLKKYVQNEALIMECWREIEQNYSDKKRYYHTLTHLEYLFRELSTIRKEIKDWDTILFTLYYHDSIYHTSGSDNEEKSAALAKKRMQELSVPAVMIEQCVRQVMATKSHTNSSDPDTNFFTDADLSILGKDWDTYTHYYKNIRKEYSMYPDFLYATGRKKVLKHFLNMDRIFKSHHFHLKYEEQARYNLKKEMTLL